MKVRAIVIGYGSRGAAYSVYSARYPEELEIVAVADPIANRREYAAKIHSIPDERIFSDWRELETQPKKGITCCWKNQWPPHLPSVGALRKQPRKRA